MTKIHFEHGVSAIEVTLKLTILEERGLLLPQCNGLRSPALPLNGHWIQMLSFVLLPTFQVARRLPPGPPHHRLRDLLPGPHPLPDIR